MTARELIGDEINVLGTAKASSNGTSQVNIDDIDLSTTAAFEHGDRILVVFNATYAATATAQDTISFSVQDADDNAGSIGTPATAITDGTLTGGTDDQYAITGVRLQADRPWLRLRCVVSDTNDAFVVTTTVLGLPPGV